MFSISNLRSTSSDMSCLLRTSTCSSDKKRLRGQRRRFSSGGWTGRGWGKGGRTSSTCLFCLALDKFNQNPNPSVSLSASRKEQLKVRVSKKSERRGGTQLVSPLSSPVLLPPPRLLVLLVILHKGRRLVLVFPFCGGGKARRGEERSKKKRTGFDPPSSALLFPSSIPPPPPEAAPTLLVPANQPSSSPALPSPTPKRETSYGW